MRRTTKTGVERTRSRRFIGLMHFSITCAPAFANYLCQGVPTQVTVSPSGTVAVGSAAGLSWVYLCSVNSTANGVDPAACKAILATLLTAQANSSTVTFWFSDSLTCTTHPDWSWLTGWYFGPSMQ